MFPRIERTSGTDAGSNLRDVARLHHVGFVVASILNEVDGFAHSIQASWNETIIHDPQQKARVTFLQPACSTDALIELVEPAGDGSPVLQFLQNGGGLHHLCYEVPDLEACLEQMRRAGAVIVRRPRPAVAFANRRIAWTITKQKLLLEFLEQQAAPPGIYEAQEETRGSIG